MGKLWVYIVARWYYVVTSVVVGACWIYSGMPAVSNISLGREVLFELPFPISRGWDIVVAPILVYFILAQARRVDQIDKIDKFDKDDDSIGPWGWIWGAGIVIGGLLAAIEVLPGDPALSESRASWIAAGPIVAALAVAIFSYCMFFMEKFSIGVFLAILIGGEVGVAVVVGAVCTGFAPVAVAFIPLCIGFNQLLRYIHRVVEAKDAQQRQADGEELSPAIAKELGA